MKKDKYNNRLGKLTLGSFNMPTGRGGFGRPSPIYDDVEKRYRSLGLVWHGQGPVTKDDLEYMLPVFRINTAAQKQSLRFDSLSLVGKFNPTYASAYQLHTNRVHPHYGTKSLTFQEIVPMVDSMTYDEVVEWIEDNAKFVEFAEDYDFDLSTPSHNDIEIMDIVRELEDKDLSEMSEVEVIVYNAFNDE